MINEIAIPITREQFNALEDVLNYTGDKAEWDDYIDQLQENVDLDAGGLTEDDVRKWESLDDIPEWVVAEAPQTVYYQTQQAWKFVSKLSDAFREQV